MTEYLRRVNLPELPRFNESKGVRPDEALDLSLAATDRPIACFTYPENAGYARDYGKIIGKGQNNFQVAAVDNPMEEASRLRTPDVIPLVVHSATDRALFERMFADGPRFGQLLMGQLYRETPDHESPSLYVIGVANQGLDIIGKSPTVNDPTVTQKIALRRREILGNGNVDNEEFRDILKSSSVDKIIAHTLGPKGTNISQAMEQYIKSLSVEGKTEFIVHPKGVEPRVYAEMALKQVKDGVIPIHMECAVYYEMGALFDERPKEVVFADHHYMMLDAMQLASVKELEELAVGGHMRIATHPTPRPIISGWEKQGVAQWIKATSNSAAAEMVMSGEADACITTGSSLAGKDRLVSRHMIGSPWMIFTIGTSLNQEQLKEYS